MSGFKINNVDLDDILQMKTWFTTSGSTLGYNSNFKVGGTDIKNRYAAKDISPNDQTPQLTQFYRSNNDLRNIFCAKNEVYPDRFVKVEIWGGRGSWNRDNFSPGPVGSNLRHYVDHGRIAIDNQYYENEYYENYYNNAYGNLGYYEMNGFKYNFLGCGAKQTSYHVLDFSSQQKYYIIKCYGGSGGDANGSGKHGGDGGRTLALAKKSSGNSASDIIAVAGAGGGAGEGNGIMGACAWFENLDYDEGGVGNEYKLEYTKYRRVGGNQDIVERGTGKFTGSFDPTNGSIADQTFYNNIGYYSDWAYGIHGKHWHADPGGGGWMNGGIGLGTWGGFLYGGQGLNADGRNRSAGGGGGGAGMYGGGGGGCMNGSSGRNGVGHKGSPGGGSGSSFAERISLMNNNLHGHYTVASWLPSVEFDPRIRITYYALENRSTYIHTEDHRFSTISSGSEIPSK